MGWIAEMAAGWLRIMAATDGGTAQLDAAVSRVTELAAAEEGGRQPGKSGFGRRKRGTSEPAVPPLVTVLSRQIVAGAMVSDLAIARLCAVTGQDRAQVLEGLSEDVADWLGEEQVGVLRLELLNRSQQLQGADRPSYAGLGNRIEELLRLAEEQAVELIEAARAEAASIRQAATTPEDEGTGLRDVPWRDRGS